MTGKREHNLNGELPMTVEELRKGDWFQSLKGRKVYPLDPRPEDVDIEEIAHVLGNICRYGGHGPFYSVAQHSVHVMECVGSEGDPEAMLVALLHDAAETYLGDVIRPLKRGGAVTQAYLDAEKSWGRTIGVALGVNGEALATLPQFVKVADDQVLLAERRDILAQSPHQWRERDYLPWAGRISPWAAGWAKTRFLSEFERLKAMKDLRS